MRHKIYLILLCTFASAGIVSGQCPGPAVRTALLNLQKAVSDPTFYTVQNALSGQVPVSDDCGNLRYTRYVVISDTCLSANPTGPVVGLPPSTFIKICGSDSLFYIDWRREPLFIGEVLTITQILDSVQADTNLQFNWYNHNDTTTDLLRTATIKRSAWWRSIDTIGFLRLQVGLIDGGRANINQDSASIYFEGGTRDNWVSVKSNRIDLKTSGGLASINFLSDTINFYNRYYFSNTTPSPAAGDTSIHFWAGNGTNTHPGFMTLDDICLHCAENVVNWYTSNGVTTENSRIADVLQTATWRSSDVTQNGIVPFRWELSGGPTNEPENTVWIFPDGDSLLLLKLDQEITMHSSASYLNWADNIMAFQADSIVFESNSVQSNTKARYIFGGTPNNSTLKKFDADAVASGTFLVSNGTDWVQSSAGSEGFVLQNGNSFGAGMTIGTNDNNSLSLETNGTSRVTISSGATTGGVITQNTTSANTTSVENITTIKNNSTGTPGTGFGSGIVFQLESSTTNDRDAAKIQTTWTNSTDGARTSNFQIFGVAGGAALSNYALLSAFGLTIGNGTADTYRNNSIQSANVFQVSSTNSASGALSIVVANSAAAANGLFINNGTHTSGQKLCWEYTDDYTPTSGTGTQYNIGIKPTINQTGGANGVTGGILFDPTFTAVGSNWSALSMPTNSSSAKFINQTGANTTSTHVGAFGFGSTTVPTDKIEITGNIALLSAGNKIKIASGSNASIGTATLVGGTVTVNTTAVATGSTIFVSCNTPGGTQGVLSAPASSITNATSFVINSTNVLDTSTVNWWIIN